nr:hypothetical protein [Acinetobacter gyllenbergii]
MLTILVEIMMSVFIANFKASEHPIINVVVRGVVIGVTVLCIIFFSDFIEGKKSSFLLGFMISFIGGFLIRANSNMRCDSFKSHMIINKLSKFL